jgi:Flp pilus assembly protein TadG
MEVPDVPDSLTLARTLTSPMLSSSSLRLERGARGASVIQTVVLAVLFFAISGALLDFSVLRNVPFAEFVVLKY